MKYIVMSIVATVVAMAVTSCHQPTDSSTSGLVTVMCDQTFENIIQQEIDVFEYTYPNASVIPYYVDAKSAIDSMIDGRTSLISNSGLRNSVSIALILRLVFSFLLICSEIRFLSVAEFFISLPSSIWISSILPICFQISLTVRNVSRTTTLTSCRFRNFATY